MNGVNINHENHKQVVSRIKAVPDETRLLVVDAATEKFFRDNDLVVHGHLPNVLHGTSLKTKDSSKSPISNKTSVNKKASVSSAGSVDSAVRDVDLSRNASSVDENAKEDLVDHRYHHHRGQTHLQGGRGNQGSGSGKGGGSEVGRRISRDSEGRHSLEDEDRESNHSGVSAASSTEKVGHNQSS